MEVTKLDSPFPVWIFRNALASNLTDPCMQALMIYPDHFQWSVYDNDCEKKRTSIRALDKFESGLFSELKDSIDALFGEIQLHIQVNADLQLDNSLHGAGIHVTDPGGYLQPHIDYSCHPNQGNRERRLNLICFLNQQWKPAWGGGFLLCDDMGIPQEVIYPECGSVIAWEPTDTSFHGVSQVIGPIPRVTFALYYLAEKRPTATRKRALFIPKRY